MSTSHPPTEPVSDATDRYLLHHGIRPDEGPILVGVSGGPDSMVLADVLRQLRFDIHLVHVNYGVRGADADADEALVLDWCQALGIPFDRVDGSAALESVAGRSLQASARRVRYRAFRHLADSHGMRYVAVGHNRDDQVETILMNLLRKTGFDGVAGMRPVRPLDGNAGCLLIRPLLQASRRQILDYAGRCDVPWRSDASNEDRRFLRARFRHDVIPALRRVAGAGVKEDLLEAADAMRLLVDVDLPAALEAGLLPEAQRDGRQHEGSRPEPSTARAVVHALPLHALRRLDPAVRAWLYLRVIRKVLPGVPARRSSVEAIESLLDAPVGKRVDFPRGTVWRERTALRFTLPNGKRGGAGDDDRIRVEVPVPGASAEVVGRFGRLVVDHLGELPSDARTDPRVVFVDGSRIHGRIYVRPWAPGDRFRPFGMKGSRKVKAVLTDTGVPASEREGIHVLCDEERIIWVVGCRMDEHFRIGRESKRVLRIRHESARE